MAGGTLAVCCCGGGGFCNLCANGGPASVAVTVTGLGLAPGWEIQPGQFDYVPFMNGTYILPTCGQTGQPSCTFSQIVASGATPADPTTQNEVLWWYNLSQNQLTIGWRNRNGALPSPGRCALTAICSIGINLNQPGVPCGCQSSPCSRSGINQGPTLCGWRLVNGSILVQGV